ncbi:MAG: hypothetical protein LBP75_06230 [Planctomycetota bacterium]|nr:hypothetical protein [Planctomycetota bacterium]
MRARLGGEAKFPLARRRRERRQNRSRKSAPATAKRRQFKKTARQVKRAAMRIKFASGVRRD